MSILTSTSAKIEHAQPPLPEISRQLGQIGGPGKFATHSTAPAGDLHLKVRGVGRVPFPITLTIARRLCRVARPALHGFKTETRFDPRVRDTWEVAKGRISIDQSRWTETLAMQLDRIRRDLGLPDGYKFKAQLHNLLVYGPGQFFAPHQDSVKTDDMIGTLVVSLPSRFTGGIMSIEHQGATVRVGGSEKNLTFVSFYADCRHEVRPIKQGYRVVLTYNLIVGGSSTVAEAPATNLVRSIHEFFTQPRPARWSGDRSAEHPPDRLVYLLDHEYTQQGLQWSRLKNADARRAAALRAAATELDCEILLALADTHETWSCEEEFSSYSHYGGRFYGDDADGDGSDWVDTGGQSEGVSARVDATELCFTKPSTDFEPFESEHEGYMGNYGNTVEHWYHRAASPPHCWSRSRSPH